jgi:hypothetical protein
MGSLIDLVNQFITEHGSDPILEKYITLLKDKAEEFERKFLLSDSEILALRNENELIKAENANLNEKLKTYEQPAHDIVLHDEQNQVLILLANSGMNENEIIAKIGRTQELVPFNLEELRVAGLIESVSMAGIVFFSLTQDGRRYLKKNGLIL